MHFYFFLEQDDACQADGHEWALVCMECKGRVTCMHEHAMLHDKLAHTSISMFFDTLKSEMPTLAQPGFVSFTCTCARTHKHTHVLYIYIYI